MLYPPGTRVGKFEIKAELGKGAMGVVYVARDPVLERDVALKVMAATVLDDPDLKERFQREAQAVAKLQSPNIVTVYDFGHDSQQAPFIAMELLSGIDLEAKMRSDPPSLHGKIHTIIQVCQGLSHAHRHGIVHRDIKPANIFLTQSGLVKIMDFGTARLVESSHTQTGTVMGTVAYMSPEQIQGLKVDGRSDLFSLGVVLYRLLCHQQPFGGENVHHIIYKILNVQPASLALPDGVSVPPLQLIVDRALAKDVEQRYQTAEEMASDLNKFLQSHAGSLTEDTVFRTIPLSDITPQPPPVSSPTPGTTLMPAADGAAGEEPTVKTQAPATDLSPATEVEESRTGDSRSGQGGPSWRTLAAAAVFLAALAVAAFFAGRFGDRTPAGDAVLTDANAGGAATNAGPTPTPGGESTSTDSAAESSTSGSATRDESSGPPETAGESSTTTSSPPPASVPPPTVSPPPPPPRAAPQPAPPPAAAPRSDQTVLAVRAALAAADFERAAELIAEGRAQEPANPAWERLDGQRLAGVRNAEGAAHLRQGVDFYTAGQYESAVAAYDQAIAAYKEAERSDPQNADALDGQVKAAGYKRQAQQAQSEPTVAASPSASRPERQLTSGETVFAPAGSGAPSGFVEDETLGIQQATSAASSPAELMIDLVPPDARPGAPYVLKVRLRNKSHATLFAKSLELVSSYRDRVIGKGNEINLSLRRIDSQDTAQLHEVRDVWSEELDTGGEVTATVTLGDGGKLSKTLSWTASQ